MERIYKVGFGTLAISFSVLLFAFNRNKEGAALISIGVFLVYLGTN